MLDRNQTFGASGSSGWSRTARHLAASAALGGALLASREARALPLVDIAGNLRALYGVTPGQDDLDPTGFGLGISGGVTLPLSIYLGASFNWFFGDSRGVSYRDAASGQQVAHADYSTDSWQLLAHLGYDLGVGPLTLRPSVAAGLTRDKRYFSGDHDPFQNDSAFARYAGHSDDFLFSPGLEGLLSFGLWDVSAELRLAVPVTPGVDYTSWVFGVGAGVSL